MKTILNIQREAYPELLRRPGDAGKKISGAVRRIIGRVETGGDRALRELNLELDGYEGPALELSPASLREAGQFVEEPLKQAIAQARTNIEAFHRAQMPADIQVETSPGVRCAMRYLPIRRAGIYIPGGTAPLLSSVLMTLVPATLAGCRELIVCTPPGASPALRYTLGLFNTRVFMLGGAQAIAAMALGTQSIPRADKIFGPGNAYVTEAKMQLAGRGLAIDMPAGPSEVMVVADETATPSFVAADLLSQAEHGPDSQVVLLATGMHIIEEVLREVERQLQQLPRQKVARQAMAHSLAICVKDLDQAIDISNYYGPEHLILSVGKARAAARQIHNAGSVFLGHYTPESAGDYASGTNHTLPTGGASRAWSGITLSSFMKSISFQEITPKGLRQLASAIVPMARAEQLEGHARAVLTRLPQKPGKNKSALSNEKPIITF